MELEKIFIFGSSCGQSVLSCLKVTISLLLSEGLSGPFEPGKLSSVCSGLLQAEILGHVLLLGDFRPGSISALLIQNGKNSGNSLSRLLTL